MKLSAVNSPPPLTFQTLTFLIIKTDDVLAYSILRAESNYQKQLGK